ncbi:MAG: hypothetical protein GX575_05325 [Candidatus Anammoximicrobium sp.]|nr:hypothetical protein [Candidatus Anammoximicrobium sp.]
MNSPRWISPLFWLTAAYDGLLGLAFLAAPGPLFELCQVTPPNHLGYVQFPAALLLIFGLMFVAIALDPVGKRHLIGYGILLKAAYCGVAGYHWAAAGIPGMWKPFVVIDLVMGLLFVGAYLSLGKAASRREAAG